MSLATLRLMLLAGAALGICLAVAGSSAAQDTPTVGKPGPKVDLPATQIESVFPDRKGAKTLNLADFQGKKNVVLFFYPRALTSGCTVESCGFRDKVADFAKLDTVIIGISTDTLELQQKFTDKHMLNFPLFADTDKTVTKAFGVLNPNGTAQRKTFVFDKKGVLRKIYDKVTPASHPEEVLKFVKEELAK